MILTCGGAFQTDIITVFVGPEKKKLTAHKGYVAKATYFAACLEHGLKEENSDEIHLPEDDVLAFEMLLGYLYNDCIQNIEQGDRTRTGVTATRSRLATAYVAADKYCFEEFHNEIINVAMENCSKTYGDPEAITKLTEAGLVDSKLRRMLVRNMAYYLAKEGFEWCQTKQHRTATFIHGGGIDGEDILKASIELAKIPCRQNPAKIEDVCEFYHVHNSTKKCQTGKK